MKTLGDRLKEQYGIKVELKDDNPEQSKETREYWDKVMQPQQEEYPFPKAENLFKYFPLQAQQILSVTGAKFIMDGNNRWVIEGLCVYFANDERFEQIKTLNENDVNKGLLLIGNCGLGKTLIAKTMHKLFTKVPKHAYGYE